MKKKSQIENEYLNRISELFGIPVNPKDNKKIILNQIQQGQGKIALLFETFSKKEKLEIIKFWAQNNKLDLLDIYAPYILSNELYDPIGIELDKQYDLKFKEKEEKPNVRQIVSEGEKRQK